MSSSFAKKQLEKYGWAEGQGLGKHGQGITTFVRAHRPKGERGEHIGIGHEASTGTSNSDMGYGKLLATLKPESKSSKPAEGDDAASNSSSGSSDAGAKKRRPREDADGAVEGERDAQKPPRAERRAPSPSSSTSSSDEDVGDVTKLDDAALFARCGGVRLGRTGRHRFFDGKIARAEQHAQSSVGMVDPYAEASLPKIVDLHKNRKKKGKK
jgi:hypothetical protein